MIVPHENNNQCILQEKREYLWKVSKLPKNLCPMLLICITIYGSAARVSLRSLTYCSYQIMLECWNEDQDDRPSFSELREKFCSLILAGKEGFYIDLQFDETKPYYVIKDEEEDKLPRLRAGSTSSKCSTASIKKSKDKKVEGTHSRKPYVGGSGCRQREMKGLAQHPLEEGDELLADQPMSRSIPMQEEELGISIAMLGADQPHHEGFQRCTTNPYVDNPRQMPSLEGRERDMVHAEVHAERSLDGPMEEILPVSD